MAASDPIFKEFRLLKFHDILFLGLRLIYLSQSIKTLFKLKRLIMYFL